MYLIRPVPVMHTGEAGERDVVQRHASSVRRAPRDRSHGCRQCSRPPCAFRKLQWQRHAHSLLARHHDALLAGLRIHAPAGPHTTVLSVMYPSRSAPTPCARRFLYAPCAGAALASGSPHLHASPRLSVPRTRRGAVAPPPGAPFCAPRRCEGAPTGVLTVSSRCGPAP